jgi:hypothetical protein
MKNTVILTAEEILSLLLEQSISREDFKISCNASFLAIMSLLTHELTKDIKHEIYSFS